MTTLISYQRSFWTDCSVFALALFSLLVLPVSADAQPLPSSKFRPTLELWDGPSRISKLTVGDDLWVSVASAPAESVLEVVLTDGSGLTIAATTLETDAEGSSEKSLLWFRSGIVGCDEPGTLDSLSYRFRDHPEAESLLQDETLSVVLRSPLGIKLRRKALSFEVDATARYFFSDATGCPRSVFWNDQHIFLSGYKAAPGDEETTIFLVDQDNPISPTGVIKEVRTLYQHVPQTLSPELASESWTALLWLASSTDAGRFGTFIRIGGVPGSYQLTEGDQSVGAYVLPGQTRDPHGITIKDWGCPVEESCSDG